LAVFFAASEALSAAYTALGGRDNFRLKLWGKVSTLGAFPGLEPEPNVHAVTARGFTMSTMMTAHNLTNSNGPPEDGPNRILLWSFGWHISISLLNS